MRLAVLVYVQVHHEAVHPDRHVLVEPQAGEEPDQPSVEVSQAKQYQEETQEYVDVYRLEQVPSQS